ncbi:hypothetical protein FRC12_005850 [Ceratobasidium sp. 428]|nr:hypothetical protein FRC12_005850 [Ceratobasidium sp. 428]
MVSCSSGMLSNIPLRWMIRQTFNSQTGILFDYQVVEGYRKAKVLEKPAENTNQKFMWNKRIEASNELDNEDLKGKPRDIFGSNPFWNLLEMMPFLKPKPHIGKGSGGTAMGWPNMWNGRAIYLPNEKAPIFLHSSVVHYINSKAQSPANGGVVGATATKQYWPKARWIGYEEKWPQVEDLYYEKTEVNSDDFLKETKTVLNMEHLPPVQSQPNGGRSQWFRFLFGK